MYDSVSKYGVVIVAGGNGQRMGSGIPKQFLPLGESGKPIIIHTIERFIESLPERSPIVVVVPQYESERFAEIALRYGIGERVKVCHGAETRFGSVRNGLMEIECRIVAVHDGVRPLVSRELIERTFSIAENHGSAIPFVHPTDSFRMDCGDGRTVVCERDRLMAVQTPQVFKYNDIRAAYDEPYNPRFTDDAGVFEAAGFSLYMCEGDRRNIKITTPFDIAVTNALIRK